MIEVCFCEKAHFYFIPPPSQSKLLFFGWGIWGWWGELVYLWWIFISNRSLGLMGDFGLLVNVIFIGDEKNFDWAAFGGGLCEFGIG